MSPTLKRRQFLQASLATAASIGVSKLHASAFGREEHVEAVVIGSGFGGAVASLRLGQAGIETIILERGRRWQITDAGDTFSTYQEPDGRSTWLSPSTIVFDQVPIDTYTGVFDCDGRQQPTSDRIPRLCQGTRLGKILNLTSQQFI